MKKTLIPILSFLLILSSCKEDDSNDESLTVTDYDGNIYPTVQIGDQIWMAENLKTTHYADGSVIQLVESSTDWENLTATEKAYCFYENNTEYGNKYGALYTWSAAMNGTSSSNLNPSNIQGVCPDGWHLPSDSEWTEMTEYLGGSEVAGGKLKESGTENWNYPNTGATEIIGFNALPSGDRNTSGTFYYLGEECLFWTSTANENDDAWHRGLNYNSSEIVRYNPRRKNGYSVRCVKN